MIFKTEGVVLKKNKISDSDVILTIFTRKSGKLKAVAKGARRPKGKLSSASHPFVFGEFVIYKGSNLDRISSAEVYESFYKIREDLQKLSYASYFLELCDSVVVEGVTNNRLLRTLLRSLYLITYKDINLDILKLAFEIKMLLYTGLAPEITKCVNCSNPLELSNFSVEHGGILCRNCSEELNNPGFMINNKILNIMNYLLKKDVEITSKLKMNENYIITIDKILEEYISYHLDKKKYKSLDFLKEIKNID